MKALLTSGLPWIWLQVKIRMAQHATVKIIDDVMVMYLYKIFDDVIGNVKHAHTHTPSLNSVHINNIGQARPCMYVRRSKM